MFFSKSSKYLRIAPYWAVTQRVVVIPSDVSGQPIGPIFKGKEDWTDRLSRNVGKELQLLATQ